MTEVRECGRILCPSPGTARPIVSVRSWIGEAGWESTFDVAVCAVHQADTKVEDLVGDEGWRILSIAYEAVHPGESPPLRGLTSVRWEPLGESPIFDRVEVAS